MNRLDNNSDTALRDLFAAMAMQELINPRFTSAWQWIKGQFGVKAIQAGATEDTVSRSAYIYADAMLRARDNQSTPQP